jgi:hypothetical protein
MIKPFSHRVFIKIRGKDAYRQITEAEIEARYRRWEQQQAREESKPIAEAAVRRAIARAKRTGASDG